MAITLDWLPEKSETRPNRRLQFRYRLAVRDKYAYDASVILASAKNSSSYRVSSLFKLASRNDHIFDSGEGTYGLVIDD